MWEEGVRIYGTSGVYNNFPSLHAYLINSTPIISLIIKYFYVSHFSLSSFILINLGFQI